MVHVLPHLVEFSTKIEKMRIRCLKAFRLLRSCSLALCSWALKCRSRSSVLTSASCLGGFFVVFFSFLLLAFQYKETVEWLCFRRNKKCYFFTREITWDEVYEICDKRLKGARMAIIENAVDSDVVTALRKKMIRYRGTWVGARTRDNLPGNKPSNHFWVMRDGSLRSLTYQRWARKEPHYADLKCLSYEPDDEGWENWGCNRNRAGLCERPKSKYSILLCLAWILSLSLHLTSP